MAEIQEGAVVSPETIASWAEVGRILSLPLWAMILAVTGIGIIIVLVWFAKALLRNQQALIDGMKQADETFRIEMRNHIQKSEVEISLLREIVSRHDRILEDLQRHVLSGG